MTNNCLDVLTGLSTPHLADACLRVGVPVHCAPSGLRGIATNMRCHGRALPVRHVGSVDIFLEAFEQARAGDVLVVDNDGRTDEACVGDLITLEAKNAGLSGIVIWGLHRDTSELLEIGLPVFSLGTMPTGPQRLHPRSPDALAWARIGPWIVTSEDIVTCDADGALIFPASTLTQVVEDAIRIRSTERHHAQLMREGTTFRAQTRFSEYLAKRKQNPALGFREHLKSAGNAIEA